MTLYYGLALGARWRGAMRLTGLILLILFTYIIAPIARQFPVHFRVRQSMRFHRMARRIAGIKLVVQGEPTAARPTLYVSNHSSYFDIFVLGGLVDASFIAKAEIEQWPIFPALCHIQETLFVKREGREAGKQKNVMTERLLRDDRLVLFAEGTTSDGSRVLPFRSSLFAAALAPDGQKMITVQPVSIIASAINGFPITQATMPLYAWYGDMTLFAHLWPLLCLKQVTVSVTFHPPTNSLETNHRKALCDYCYRYVSAGVSTLLRGMPPQALSAEKPNPPLSERRPAIHDGVNPGGHKHHE